MNYPLIALIILLALAVVVLLAWKNQKDKKKMERDMNRSEIKPEKHDENKSSLS
jgi:FtsZ-interacting cell division protein ZipA